VCIGCSFEMVFMVVVLLVLFVLISVMIVFLGMLKEML